MIHHNIALFKPIQQIAGFKEKEQQQQQRMETVAPQMATLSNERVVELILSASGLANLDKFSKSDPICVVEQCFWKNNGNGTEVWCEIGRTETIMDNLEPKWSRQIQLNCGSSPEQKHQILLRFSCYDIDSNKQALVHHDFLGRCECRLSNILQAPNCTLKMRLKKDNGAYAKGEFRVHAETLPASVVNKSPMVHFEVRGLFSSPAQKLHHAIVGTAGANVIKPTPPSAYLEFYRIVGEADSAAKGAEQQQEDGNLMVHRTECAKNTWYPEWEKFEVPLRLLVGLDGNVKKHFLIQCYDTEACGNHKLIGSIQTSVEAFIAGQQWRVELVDNADGTLNAAGGMRKRSEDVREVARKTRNEREQQRQHEMHKKQGHLHFIHVSVSGIHIAC